MRQGLGDRSAACAVSTVAHQAVGLENLLATGDGRCIIPAAAAGLGIVRWRRFPPGVLVRAVCGMPVLFLRVSMPFCMFPVRGFLVVLVLTRLLVGAHLDPQQVQRYEQNEAQDSCLA